MTRMEVRMRCLEVLAQTGVREPKRFIEDAKRLEDWVMAVADTQGQAKAPKTAGKTAGGRA